MAKGRALKGHIMNPTSHGFGNLPRLGPLSQNVDYLYVVCGALLKNEESKRPGFQRRETRQGETSETLFPTCTKVPSLAAQLHVY